MSVDFPLPDADELYARLAARMDSYQVEGWSGRQGEEFFRAAAAAAAATIQRIRDRIEPRQILVATKEARATGTLTLTFPATTLGFGLNAGQVILRTVWGLEFVLRETLQRYSGQSAGDEAVEIEAKWAGPEYNIPADLDLPTSRIWTIPFGLDDIDKLTWGAWYNSVGTAGVTLTGGKAEFLTALDAGDITFTVSATTGGLDANLDAIAAGRGMPRALDEMDAALRRRLRTLPDTVTPAAILRAVNAAIAEYGLADATLIEPWDYGFAFGAGAFGVDPPTRPWHFVVIVPSLPYDTEGYAFGGGAFGVEPFGVGDTARAGVYAGLQALVDRIKLGGVYAVVAEED